MTELSIRCVDPGDLSDSALNTCTRMSALAQPLKRLQTVGCGPYRRGGVRLGEPVLSIWRMPLITRQSSTRGTLRIVGQPRLDQSQFHLAQILSRHAKAPSGNLESARPGRRMPYGFRSWRRERWILSPRRDATTGKASETPPAKARLSPDLNTPLILNSAAGPVTTSF